MSLLHDPYDLIQKGHKMDNIVPFLSQGKIDMMVERAMETTQFPMQQRRPLFWAQWRFAGVAVAACLAFILLYLPPLTESRNLSEQNYSSATEDVGEFSELVMLDTWDKY